jgi:flagellin-like protein
VKKGISPVIATVILVAVALVLAVALAGWVMGIWGGLGSTEALQIAGSISKVGNTVWVNATILNKGTAPANITKVEMIDESGSVLTNTTTNAVVSAGGTLTYDFNMSSSTGSVAVSKTYVVRFYTSSGNVYEVPMKCVKGS